MAEILETIKEIEDQIEEALWTFEVRDEIEKALEIYLHAESELVAINIATENSAYPEQQRVLSYCLLRQGNIQRQMKKEAAAFALGEREIIAARASGDDVTLARSLMSNGVNHITAGKAEKGLALLGESRRYFESGESHAHRQGLGWYYILQADLAYAGIIKKEPTEIVEIANHVLEILKPIENWPGVARAYASRAKAYERLGNEEMASADRKMQHDYESKVELNDRKE